MRTFVMVPTYNERANVGELVRLLHESVPDAEVLIVDDSSPDGTFEEVRLMAQSDPKLRLLLRPREVKGRGWAGRDGFLEALAQGAGIVVEMDADLSHQPRSIPALLAPILSKEADVVVGSRYIRGGKDADRPPHRRLTTFLAGRYLRCVLGVRTKDPTSGFRAFSSAALKAIRVETLQARDPFTVSEIMFRCFRAGLRVKEVPIEFLDRTRGESKLRPWTLVKYLSRALGLRLRPGFKP